MLYTLFNSPSSCNFSLLLNYLNQNDDLLLIQDGVIAGLKNSIFMEEITKVKQKMKILIFAINNDILARGLDVNISKKVVRIDYIEFVNLVIKNKKQIIW
ncbi:sulfurtransferase complex subunit TusB [Enterobacteriaceae endosymbiont of Donacia bicoloricornis]|uniref:sulfurtransferase complex subunit TusB n=1 Tax=Enterobacteriaceae endosymbiont of Donacia bicoloricornis TaxID=2675772 RepID=UPI001448C56B|nr:sulfurtransferase complex subunit TusB [Enterobacteriaceae endosymbiont of Donacia bicoloricornis]QJC37841.1 sulfurtransferase complex subunit TusB [Enterobacteriaceae endosymbiont of Donacia bicoloricornis]